MTGQKISITSPQNISAEIDSLERTFKALLGREVTLSVGAQESSLAIQYESGAQLDAIVSLLIAPNEAQSLFERSGSSAENDESLISTSEPNRRNQSVITLPRKKHRRRAKFPFKRTRGALLKK